MSELRVLSPIELAGVLRSCADVLADHAAAIDQLEHVPSETDEDATATVPPGSGTTLAAAMSAAATAASTTSDLTRLGEAVASACSSFTGRAGRVLAKMTAGWSEGLHNADRIDGLRMSLMLEAGAEALTGSDDGAHPGGPAAVAAAAADAALAAADDGSDLAEVLLAAADSGLVELERGPISDPDLAGRGVVDAVAAGFLLIIDVMASVVTGEPLPELPSDPFPLAATSSGVADQFDVRCRLDLADGVDPVEWLRPALVELGEVRALSPVGEQWLVDVGTAFPGAVVETLVDAGRPRELHIGLQRSHPDSAVR